MSQDEKVNEEKVNNDNQAAAAEATELQQEAATEQAEQAAEASKNDKENKKRGKHKGNVSEEKIQELGEKLAELNDKYLRAVADFENYRRHSNQEKADLLINGAKETIKAVLPVIDDMERALASMADDDPAKEGVQLIFNKLMNILGQKGLKPMEAKGQKFDSNLHEAVAQIPAPEEAQKGMVIDETVKGYYLNDKVIRFAKVVVAN